MRGRVTAKQQGTSDFRHNQIYSLILLAGLVVVGALFTSVWPHAFVVALSTGALGGLAHEIVQSQGKFMLPNTDDSGNFCLGGLVGVVEGAVAGLLAYQGLLGTAPGLHVTMQLILVSIVGGFAAKGVADEAPKIKTQVRRLRKG
jgi:hypothetical protein